MTLLLAISCIGLAVLLGSDFCARPRTHRLLQWIGGGTMGACAVIAVIAYVLGVPL